jgi:hypothetical protein
MRFGAPRMLLDPVHTTTLLSEQAQALDANVMQEIYLAQTAGEAKELVDETLDGLGRDVLIFLTVSVFITPLGKALNLSVRCAPGGL